MSFFTICPRDKKYLDLNIGEIELEVIRSDGVEINPDFKTTVNKLNKGYRQFVRQNGFADSFNISVIINRNTIVSASGQRKKYIEQHKVSTTQYVDSKEWSIDIDGVPIGTASLEYSNGLTTDSSYVEPLEVIQDVKEDKTVTFLLDYFMRNAIPLYVNSDIIGLQKDALYLITSNKSRKQDYMEYTVWDLTFTKYVEFTMSKFKGNTKGVTDAIKAYKNKNKAKKKLTNAQKLAKCKNNWRKTLVYSKKKKVHNCVKYMQKILKSGGFYKKKIHGWYNHDTYLAVKEYQKKYKKKYHLKVTGKVDQQTFNCLIGKPNQVGATQNITTKIKTNKTKDGIITVGVDLDDMSKYTTLNVKRAEATDTTVYVNDKSTVTVTQPSTSVINANGAILVDKNFTQSKTVITSVGSLK